MRCALLVAIAFATAGCASEPAFPVPSGPPTPVAVEVAPALWTSGRAWLDDFRGELRERLRRYNITLVDARDRSPYLARVNLGEGAYRQGIDVWVEHDRTVTPATRLRIPDYEMTTLEASAPLIAEIIARDVYGDAPGRTR
jgi:hypothetical protein